MYNPSMNWIEQIKFIVREMLNAKSFVLEGLVTSVDPKPPCKVKVMLQPYEIETGWLRLATPCHGGSVSLVLPPPEEGMPVKVIFDLGDIKHGTVIGNVPNDKTVPPDIPSGSAGFVHQSGSSLLIGPDGTVTIKGKAVKIQGPTTIQGPDHSQSW
ncbi:phage baseplate assembly protein V [Tumebacillus flagellatus]|uniref:Gp5/Type VI secretion system Vgr protein OB-fold domain-containing protein n=1 Tax=Tumebacillus flagellatus TaxID=1157490 RepID=A0A074LQM8_9BACL|nr:phage baseplate assembly protein V [Tumebacillus flagellatus]KEO82098.1 hypothetical protein EL26_17465 [Tumebacillus flagellatus]